MPYNFQALSVALTAADHVLPLLEAVPPPYRKIASQCRESTVSVPLNLAEGAGRFGGDRRYHYSVALGSAKEAKATLRVLRAAKAIDSSRGVAGIELLDRVCALTWRLIHPRGR